MQVMRNTIDRLSHCYDIRVCRPLARLAASLLFASSLHAYSVLTGGEPLGGHRISQARPEVWPHGHLRRRQDLSPQGRVQLRRIAGARGNYAPQAYHDFIGFQVEKEVLARAFRDTYSMELADIFGDLDLALGTYRRAVSTVIPELTRVAWHLKRDELAASQPSVTRRKFVYNQISRGLAADARRAGEIES
jgi:hypothetical protein